MPMIMAIVVPSCYLGNRYIGPYSQSGKAIRGFPGHLIGSGRQLPEIDIEIRYIVQVEFSCPLIANYRRQLTAQSINLPQFNIDFAVSKYI